MKFTVLGCGTSSGVPVLTCQCKVCQSSHPRNQRLRSSIWLEVTQNDQVKHLIIDTTPDFRQQALREKIPRVDAVLYTHPHADHLHGIDELRSYNYFQNAPIPVFGNRWTYDDLQLKFPYIFDRSLLKLSAVPELNLHLIDPEQPQVSVVGIPVVPLPVEHGRQACLGFRLGQWAYVTDCSLIPSHTLARMQDLEVLILDCVQLKPHKTHYNLQQALETIEFLKPKRVFLTHLSHDLDYEEWEHKLPPGVALAYDGLSGMVGDG